MGVRRHPEHATAMQKPSPPPALILRPELKGAGCQLGIRLIGTVGSAHHPRLAPRRCPRIDGAPSVNHSDPRPAFEQMQGSPSSESASTDHRNVGFVSQWLHRQTEENSRKDQVSRFQGFKVSRLRVFGFLALGFRRRSLSGGMESALPIRRNRWRHGNETPSKRTIAGPRAANQRRRHDWPRFHERKTENRNRVLKVFKLCVPPGEVLANRGNGHRTSQSVRRDRLPMWASRIQVGESREPG